MIRAAVYDSKPYTRQFFDETPGSDQADWRFIEAKLDRDSAWSAKDCQAACVFVNCVANRPVLEVLAQLGVSLIALRSAGYNNVDLDAARNLGLDVVRVPAYSPEAVAEHTLGLLLALNRRIHRAYNRVREQNFARTGLMGFNLEGKTVGVIGTGRIGKTFIELLCGFKVRVLAYDVKPDQHWAEKRGVRYVPLNELLSGSDVISLHAPLTPETHHIINAQTIDRMKNGAYLINTSRGKLIDTTPLIEALKSGKLGGVALDVYEEEENVFSRDLSDQVLQDDELARLLTFPNVLITAHQAFFTREALAQITRTTVDNVLRFASDQPYLEGTVLVEAQSQVRA